MRLRYLHLPDYGVLRDLKVEFRDETILSRKGSLQFVVGLNGTGKSSLLRAVYETFRWLEAERVPPFPVALVYELQRDNERAMVMFRHLCRTASEAAFAVIPEGWELWEACTSDKSAIDWDEVLESVDGDDVRDSDHWAQIVNGDRLSGNQLVRQYLPSSIVAYTSGDLDAWEKVRQVDLSDVDLSYATYDGLSDDQDRPRGWTLEREMNSPEVAINKSERSAIQSRTSPADRGTDGKCILLEPQDLKLAAISAGLIVAVRELADVAAISSPESWRSALRTAVAQQLKGERPAEKDARTLLNEIDWWWPTHLSITYRPPSQQLNSEWLAQWMALTALADEVIRQPLGRLQMVIHLGRSERRIEPDIRGVSAGNRVPEPLREIVDRVDGSSSGAEAVVRVLSTVSKQSTDWNDRALWDVFRALHAWRAAGLIEEITVTVMRTTQMIAHDGQLDDVILTWDDFSDGERMLLGRMALLLLLRERDGSLLLLDEPETHFNDSWKREIIDIIDDNVLKTTAAQVMVATHTSIALTDAFASEIVRLTRENGQAVLDPVSFSTFGAEPGRVMLHVFGMQASIGSRAEQALRAYLGQKWDAQNRNELERLLLAIGGGWPRARLQQILDEMRDASPGS
ncbi:MAG: AAA family ATPase [Phycisphaerales bacterium]|nr:AAA family ATPase [Phycisphaerales bacterium]